MKLRLLAASLAALTLTAGAALAQDAGKQGPPKREAGGGGGQDMKKMRAEKVEKLKAAIAAQKVPLTTAIASVEKETKGKVFRAGLTQTKDGKFEINVGVLVDDKMGTVSVDPDSGKAEPIKFEEEREGRGEGREGREGGGKEGKKEGGGN